MNYKLRCFSELPLREDTRKIEDVILLSEEYGLTGTLIFHLLKGFDPWVLAMRILQITERLIPLIATQPYSLPPFTTAKMIKTISDVYNRKVSLNLITGVQENELLSLRESIMPEIKYKRLEEYTLILKSLLTSDLPIDFNGFHYKYDKLSTSTLVPKEFMPELFIAGSSNESIRIANLHANTVLSRPKPLKLYKQEYLNLISKNVSNIAIRISIIVRETKEEAWEVALNKYPQNKFGEYLVKKRVGILSHNSKSMAELALSNDLYDDVFWMGAYLSGNSFDPFLVGSYDEVAAYLNGYIKEGVNTMLFGHLTEEEDFQHLRRTLDLLNRDILI